MVWLGPPIHAVDCAICLVDWVLLSHCEVPVVLYHRDANVLNAKSESELASTRPQHADVLDVDVGGPASPFGVRLGNVEGVCD